MGSKNDMTRKDFLTLTFTLIGSTAVGAAACSSSNNSADGGTAGTTGTGGHGGTTGTGGHGGSGGAAGTNPLPETMIADANMHSHTLTIPASTVDATTAQMINTGVTDAHMHIVTLEPAQLTTLKGGGNVTVTTSSAGTPAHMHMYMVSCH
jgi:hypothetical protein